jgi:hypothetical protein
MPAKKIGWDTVRESALDLPDVEDGTTYGSPALKVRGKMFACMATHRSAEPGSMVVRIGFDQRDELIAADPTTYYLKDHYVNYPVMLVRLSRINQDALRDLLHMAWRFTAAGARGAGPRGPRRAMSGAQKRVVRRRERK